MKLAMGLAAVAVSMSAYASPVNLNNLIESTVYLVNQEGTYCSGYVSPGHQVVTAAHCISNPKDLVIVKFQDGSKVPFIVSELGDANKGPDIALLITDEKAIPKGIPGIPMCEFNPYYTEELLLIGAPLGVENTVSIERVSNPVVNQNKEHSLIQFEPSLFPGNSGGPAVDTKEGCVMGIADEIMLEAPALANYGLGYGLNYLTPISSIYSLFGIKQ